MASLNVPMSEDLREYVNQRAKRGGFSTPSEYVRHLIREDRARDQERRLEQLLLDGLESGPGKILQPSDWQEIRARVRRRVQLKNGKKRRTKAG